MVFPSTLMSQYATQASMSAVKISFPWASQRDTARVAFIAQAKSQKRSCLYSAPITKHSNICHCFTGTYTGSMLASHSPQNKNILRSTWSSCSTEGFVHGLELVTLRTRSSAQLQYPQKAHHYFTTPIKIEYCYWKTRLQADRQTESQNR